MRSLNKDPGEAEGGRSVAPVALTLSLLLGPVAGCGNIGPPVAPEYVGVGARLLRDKEKERAKEEERRKELEKQQGAPTEPAAQEGATVTEAESEAPEAEEVPKEEDVVLPPLRPIGTPR